MAAYTIAADSHRAAWQHDCCLHPAPTPTHSAHLLTSWYSFCWPDLPVAPAHPNNPRMCDPLGEDEVGEIYRTTIPLDLYRTTRPLPVPGPRPGSKDCPPPLRAEGSSPSLRVPPARVPPAPSLLLPSAPHELQLSSASSLFGGRVGTPPSPSTTRSV